MARSDRNEPEKEARVATLRLCSIPNCGKPHKARGWCSGHWWRWRLYGDPLKGDTPKGEPLRFFREVVMAYEGDDCLRWPFATKGDGDGRGVLRIGDRTCIVSRLVCEEAHGKPPTPKHEAAHSCGNGHLACVTKGHLSWKTSKGNKDDQLVHGTRARGERSGGAKLTAADVREIRKLRAAGAPLKDLADRYGVDFSTIGNIARGDSWAWLG